MCDRIYKIYICEGLDWVEEYGYKVISEWDRLTIEQDIAGQDHDLYLYEATYYKTLHDAFVPFSQRQPCFGEPSAKGGGDGIDSSGHFVQKPNPDVDPPPSPWSFDNLYVLETL
jgi:hypothetical protein